MMRSRRWYCCPRMARYTSTSVSGAPIQTGRPKSRLKPSAAPRYSASAVATQATAMVTPNSHTIQRGMWARTLAASERPRDDAQLGRHVLQEDQHERAERDDPQQLVAELRAAGDVGSPVAGVDEADGDHEARPEVAQQLAREQVTGEAARPPRGRARDGLVEAHGRVSVGCSGQLVASCAQRALLHSTPDVTPNRGFALTRGHGAPCGRVIETHLGRGMRIGT